jgi:hypothetical protein
LKLADPFLEHFGNLFGGESEMDGFGEEAVDKGGEAAFAGLIGEFRLPRGNEYSQAGTGVEHSLAFELGVRAGDRVRVHHQVFRELADRRESIAGLDAAAGDGLANLLDELAVNGRSGGGIALKFHLNLGTVLIVLVQ